MAPVREYNAPRNTCTAPVRPSQASSFPSIARVSLHYSRMSHHGIGEILVKSFVIKISCPVPAQFSRKKTFFKYVHCDFANLRNLQIGRDVMFLYLRVRRGGGMRCLIGGMGGGMFHPEMQFKDLLLTHI